MPVPAHLPIAETNATPARVAGAATGAASGLRHRIASPTTPPAPLRRVVRLAPAPAVPLRLVPVGTAVVAARSRRPFLTRARRQRMAGTLWIALVLAVWSVLLVYAGRDGLKPQDPAALLAPNIVRK